MKNFKTFKSKLQIREDNQFQILMNPLEKEILYKQKVFVKLSLMDFRQ